MPEAELIFRARTDGSVATESGRMRQALQAVKQDALQITREIAAANPLMPQSGIGREFTGKGNPYAVAVDQIRKMNGESLKGAETVEKHAISIRHMKGAVNTLTEALGSQNSALASAGGHIAMFQRMMSELPAGMGAAAAGILVVGAAVITHLNILEEARARHAEITRDLAEGNSAGLRGKMREQSAAMSQVEGEGFWNIGTLQDLGRKMLFAPTRWEEATEKAEDYRKALDQLLPAEKRIADAEFAQARGGLTLSGLEQSAGVKAASGSFQYTDMAGIFIQEQVALTASIAGARTVAIEKAKQEVRTAIARGASDPELALMADKREKDLYVIDEQGAQKRIDLQQKYQERRRALARVEMAEQESILKESLSRRLAAAEIGISVAGAIRQAGLTTYLGSMDASTRARFGPTAEQFATEDTLAATQAASAARVAEIGQTQTRLKAAMQGYRANNLMSEREYADKVRAMDQELTQAKMQGLQQYAQALTTALGKAASDYAKYTEDVRGLEKSIRATKQETADAVASIKQAGMTPGEAAADRERRANVALADAMRLSGQEQVDALKRVQSEYQSLGVAAAQSAREQQDAAKQTIDSFTMAGDPWRTSPGQHSEAYKKAWATTDTGPGSADWWSGGAWGVNAWSRSSTAQSQATAQTMADKVKWTGELILKAQIEQKNAAEQSATAAKSLVSSLTTAADEAARLAQALSAASAPPGGYTPWTGDLVGKLQQAADDIVGEIRGESGGTAEPSTLADGGIVRRTGIALVHRGEVVLNQGQQAAVGGSPIHLHFDSGISEADRERTRRWVREVVIPEIEKVQDAQ